MTRRQLLLARILFVMYIIAVAVLCFCKFPPSDDVPRDMLGIPLDKLVHFLMFFPFPLLAYLAYDRYAGKRWPMGLCALSAFFVGTLFAAGTEWVQSYLPYRTGDPADFKADLFAVAAGSVIVLAIHFLKHKR